MKTDQYPKRETQEMQHVFISYVSENWEIVEKLCQELESRDIKVWLDRNDINPGSRWKQAIRKAIREGAYFIACFSMEYSKRDKTYMNEELTVAIEELRQRPTDRVWFIPVKLNICKIPDRNIGAGETLKDDVQHVKLYKDWDACIQSIIKVIQPESSEKTLDESRINIEIDQRAVSEYDKGLACQKEIRETDSPEEKHDKIRNALNHYYKALKIQPDYVHALNARGGIHIFMEKYDDAIKDFNETLSLDPDYIAAYLNRGALYKTIEKNRKAIEDFSNAIRRRPDLSYAYFVRGEVFIQEGNFTQAINDNSQAIDLRSNYVEAYFNRGIAYCGKGVFGLAIEDFTQAIALNPDFTDAYCHRGIIWLHLKDWDKARYDFRVAQERNIDIIAIFNSIHENISVFERINRFKLPEDIAALLTSS